MRSLLLLVMFVCALHTIASEPDSPPTKTVRVATCQAKNRVIDWHLQQQDAVLAAADRNIEFWFDGIVVATEYIGPIQK